MSPDFTLRRAGPADAASILSLAERAYARWVPVLGRLPSPAVADYTVVLEDHRIDLLECDGKLIASVAAKLHDSFLFVESLAVDPDWQGQGIGPELLAHAEKLARDAGKPEVRLLTNAKMAANVVLYEKLGYAVFEREESPQCGLIIHMRKALQPAR